MTSLVDGLSSSSRGRARAARPHDSKAQAAGGRLRTIEGAPLAALEWGVLLLFLARAWQHLFLDTKHWAFFYNQSLLENVVTALDMPWHTYATSRTVERGIEAVITLQGLVYTGSALLLVLLRLWALPVLPRLRRAGLWLGALQLMFLALCEWLDSKRQLGQLLELSLQICAPLAVILVDRAGGFALGTIWLLRGAIAATFAGHGLYAVGFYEVPGNFVSMIIKVFGWRNATAEAFLLVVGALDFVVALAVLILPLRTRALLCVLIYAAAWGFLTSVARIYTNFDAIFLWTSISQWLHETAMRLVHGLAPVALALVAWRERRRLENQIVAVGRHS